MFTHSLTVTACHPEPADAEPEHITHYMPHVVAEATGAAEVISHLAYMATQDFSIQFHHVMREKVDNLALHENITFSSRYNGTVTITRFAESAADLTGAQSWDEQRAEAGHDPKLPTNLQGYNKADELQTKNEPPAPPTPTATAIVDYGNSYSAVPQDILHSQTYTVAKCWGAYVVCGGGFFETEDVEDVDWTVVKQYPTAGQAQARCNVLNLAKSAGASV